MSGVTTYTFPAAPEANKILLTDGDGNLSWTESFDSDLNVTGIVTATGGFNIGINSAGNTITSGPVQNLNFIGAGNTFAYNADTDTVDIAISGTGDNLTLGTSSDGDLVTPGALNTFTTETKIVDSIDDLNDSCAQHDEQYCGFWFRVLYISNCRWFTILNHSDNNCGR